MCYASPGPRCEKDISARRDTNKKNLAAQMRTLREGDKSPEAKAKFDTLKTNFISLNHEWDKTTQGQAELQSQIDAADTDERRDELTMRKDFAALDRKKQLDDLDLKRAYSKAITHSKSVQRQGKLSEAFIDAEYERSMAQRAWWGTTAGSREAREAIHEEPDAHKAQQMEVEWEAAQEYADRQEKLNREQGMVKLLHAVKNYDPNNEVEGNSQSTPKKEDTAQSHSEAVFGKENTASRYVKEKMVAYGVPVHHIETVQKAQEEGKPLNGYVLGEKPDGRVHMTPVGEVGMEEGRKAMDALALSGYEITPTTNGAVSIMDQSTARYYRAQQANSLKAASDSFQRSDTDGFASQAAHGIAASEYQAKAQLAENNGKTVARALFDTQGNIVPAKLVNNQFGGQSWMLLENDDPTSRAKGWVGTSSSDKPETQRKYLERKGYVEKKVRVPGMVIRDNSNPSARGFSGMATIFVRTIRADKGFSRDFELVDDES